MRFVGIDIAAEEHVVAIVDESGGVLLRATAFTESAQGYEKARKLIGSKEETLVVMEATGHYWQNLFGMLAVEGFQIALINPLRTRKFAEEDLLRTKTDAIDAVQLARFGQQKRPPATKVPEAATVALREHIRLRDRIVQDRDEKVNELHRVVDLCFPEFTKHVRILRSGLATTLLRAFPTAEAFRNASLEQVAKLEYGSKRKRTVGEGLARALVDAAKVSVGRHHGEAYRVQVLYACDSLDLVRRYLDDLDDKIAEALEKHEIGKLLTTIDGIGPNTAARLVAELEGDPSHFEHSGALAAYVGVVPGTDLSGKSKSVRFGIAPTGHARLRKALWMPTLVAIRCNPWLKAFYAGLKARGKIAKVAIIASMRKLLTAVYSVAKNKRAFVPRLTAAEVPS
jgi:transposase